MTKKVVPRISRKKGRKGLKVRRKMSCRRMIRRQKKPRAKSAPAAAPKRKHRPLISPGSVSDMDHLSDLVRNDEVFADGEDLAGLCGVSIEREVSNGDSGLADE